MNDNNHRHLLRNLFAELPRALPDELCQTLVDSPGLRIERIVSTGQSSPPGFWYDQGEDEWVILLRGEARLLFAGDTAPLVLRPGDYIHIPSHCRHRVEWTAPDEPTVWLAVFHGGSS